MDRSKKLGEGNIPRLLAEFSLPAIVGMLAQGLYNFVDRVFVGKALGEDHIAAVHVSLPFMLLTMAFGMLVGLGAAALISIRLGQKKRNEAEQALGTATLLLVVGSLALTAAGLLLLDPILIFSGASPQVLPLARDYLRVIMLGSVLQAIGFGLNAAIRAEGNPLTAMTTMLLGAALNVVLAPLFLFVFRWGIEGAAWATVLAQAATAIWVLGYFLGKRSLLKLRPANLRIHGALCGTMLAIGSPHFFMQIANAGLNSLLNNQLRIHGGDRAIAVWGILFPVAMMVFMATFGINQGMQPIIGYNYGARRYDRVTKALRLAILAGTAIAVMGFLIAVPWPAPLIRLFCRGDLEPEKIEALVELGSHAIRVSFLMMPAVGFQIVGAGYFLAVGKPLQGLILMLSRQILVLIPAVAILPHFIGLDGVWAAMPTADFSSCVLTAIWLLAELRHLDRRHAQTAEPPVVLEVSTEAVS
jgi:putative MATE family efflux protein